MTTKNLAQGLLLAAVAGLLFTLALVDPADAGRRSRVARGADRAVPAQDLADDSTTLQVAFITHLEMDLPEQDVFIERVPGSGEVFRVTQGDNDMRAPLYKTAVMVPHDPFDPKAVGPHPKGEPLGMTLGEWLAHRGTGTYTHRDGEGTLALEFTGLVPNGVYTMWHAFMALPPTTPFSGTLDLPLGARDGSESVFVADAQGNARFDHSFRPGLQMSDTWTTAMLAINYHSDGKTYGGLPGDFGLNAHVPLFVMLPPRDGLK
ncbi:MAG: hypothetical protein AAF533_25350 [Acidobacteriota bacterium]